MNRKNKILEILTEREKVEVVELSDMLNVSQVTIRKDLDALAEIGIIKREHGFAILSTTNDVYGRLAYHYDIKKKIAQKAATLVKDGDSIMIENGSCCAILAEELARTKKNLTIITNSAFIADYIRNKTTFDIVLLGGIYQHDSQVMVGPLVSLCAKNFLVEKFFIGVDGYSSRIGFSNKDQLRAQAVRDMALQADHVIILTESTKFIKHSTVPLNVIDKVSTVITDSNIIESAENSLKERNIEIIKIKEFD